MGNKSKLMLLYIAVLAILILSACNAERQVLRDRDASKRIFNTLALEYPCANDTSFVILKDTIYNIDTTIDYKYDTINQVITKTLQGKTIYKTKRVIEVKTGYIVDTRKIAILADSMRFYKVLYQAEHKYKKQAESRLFWLIIIIAAIFILKRFVWSYLSILR